MSERDQLTSYMLRSMETLERREFFTNTVFRIAFCLIVVLQVAALFFVDLGHQPAVANYEIPQSVPADHSLHNARVLALVFLFTVVAFGMYWYVSREISKRRMRSVREAISSVTDDEYRRVFENFTIGRMYRQSVEGGGVYTALVHLEPFLWLLLVGAIWVVAQYEMEVY